MILRFPGGKSKSSIKKIIFSYFPDFYDEYREPCCGGAGIFFSVPIDKKRWINDIDPNPIFLYNSLKERPNEFIQNCKDIKPEQKDEEIVFPKRTSKGKKYNKRLKECFDFFANNETCDQALRYFFINRTVWGGRVRYDLPSRMYFSNPSGWNIVNTDKLEQASILLKDTTITCGHYLPLLQNSGTNVLVYVDPPYYRDTELNQYSKLYRFGFTHKQHVDLASAVLNCEHKVLMSYDDHEIIRDLYRDKKLIINEAEWTYCGTTQKEKTVGKELLIRNYK